MSYQKNLKLQIEAVQVIIEKCEQMLSMKSLEDHLINAWNEVLFEAKENKIRLEKTSSMYCFQ